jgi:hypothetical protein
MSLSFEDWLCHHLLPHITRGQILALDGQSKAVIFCGLPVLWVRGRPCDMSQVILLMSAV